MSPSELMEQWMEQVWNQKNTDFIHEHMEAHCDVMGLPEGACTPDGFAVFRDQLTSGIEGMNVKMLELVENGESVAGTGRITGTHRTTGKPVDFFFALTAVVRDDKIVKAHNVVDFLTMFQQAGLVGESLVEAELLS